MSKEIILFDLPAKDGLRLLLNVKGLPYRTQWIEYPDIAPVLKELVPPNRPGGFADFTIPAVTLPDGTSIMDSIAIAQHIESQHPSPALHVNDPYVSLIATELLPKVMGALTPIYIPNIPLTLLNPPSAEYFRRTREQRLSKTLEALRDDPENGGAKAFEAARPHLDAIAALYRNGNAKAGPF